MGSLLSTQELYMGYIIENDCMCLAHAKALSKYEFSFFTTDSARKCSPNSTEVPARADGDLGSSWDEV